ncbi:hypothetical protein FGB62_11g121 [Gracilaria domingensis]|nr:hypothetical protein FGB62_11g121 [Gracilaria domingensis]
MAVRAHRGRPRDETLRAPRGSNSGAAVISDVASRTERRGWTRLSPNCRSQPQCARISGREVLAEITALRRQSPHRLATHLFGASLRIRLEPPRAIAPRRRWDRRTSPSSPRSTATLIMASHLFFVPSAPLRAASFASRLSEPATGRRNAARTRMSSAVDQSDSSFKLHRRSFLSAAALAALQLPAPPSKAERVLTPPAWSQVELDSGETIYDIDFSPVDPSHGFLVGSRGTVAETFDRGVTWQPRTFARLDADEELNYRFEVVTFRGQEGWVIGKPSLLLHTSDSGKSWERVPLSPKLPGEPVAITALGPQKAEMTTNAGAVYVTENSGRNWKAQVRETIDATLNRTISSGVTGASYFTGSIIQVLRDAYGAYLAISSRGNFFLTWKPGQEFWIPHARDSSRRIQSMGFVNNDVNDGVWMATRGGGLSFTEKNPNLESTDLLKFNKVDIRSGGYGILDVAFRPETSEVWAAVGGGTLYRSEDGGTSWRRDDKTGKVGANIYRIKFFGKDTAFALGSNGVVLRYNPEGTA